jgi:isopropylmalate/homocitrate/citramalate synthase
LQTIDSAIAAGVDGYDADMKSSVQKSVRGLRLTKEAALAIAGKVVSFFHQLYGANLLILCLANFMDFIARDWDFIAVRIFIVYLAGTCSICNLCQEG